MIVKGFSVGAFQENAYIVVDDSTGEAVLIDPGDEGDRLLGEAASLGGDVRAIWLTHAHVDHVGGIAAVKRQRDVPIALHPADRPLYDSAAQQGAYFGLPFDTPPPPDRDFAEGDTLTCGSLAFSVWHVPGHSPGHVAIVGHGVAFVGDCLFAGSVGRTDLPLANPAALAASLDRLCTLPDETVVYSGHGPATTIGEEKRSNPFLNGAMRIVARER